MLPLFGRSVAGIGPSELAEGAAPVVGGAGLVDPLAPAAACALPVDSALTSDVDSAICFVMSCLLDLVLADHIELLADLGLSLCHILLLFL